MKGMSKSFLIEELTKLALECQNGIMRQQDCQTKAHNLILKYIDDEDVTIPFLMIANWLE